MTLEKTLKRFFEITETCICSVLKHTIVKCALSKIQLYFNKVRWSFLQLNICLNPRKYAKCKIHQR